jgi:hypothetical protein
VVLHVLRGKTNLRLQYSEKTGENMKLYYLRFERCFDRMKWNIVTVGFYCVEKNVDVIN